MIGPQLDRIVTATAASTRFLTFAAWHDRVGGHLLDVVPVHQLDTLRSSNAPPFPEPERVPGLVHALAERARPRPLHRHAGMTP